MVDKFFEGGEEVYRYEMLSLDLPSKCLLRWFQISLSGAMWMTLATRTMPGWRQWPSTFMTQVVRRFASMKITWFSFGFWREPFFLTGWTATSAGRWWCWSNTMDASQQRGKTHYLKNVLHARLLIDMKTINALSAGDPVCQSQGLCWEGGWKIGSPLVIIVSI